jgi:hypothetical protein
MYNILSIGIASVFVMPCFFKFLTPLLRGAITFLIHNPFSIPFTLRGHNFSHFLSLSKPFQGLLMCQICQEEGFKFCLDKKNNKAVPLDPACLECLSVQSPANLPYTGPKLCVRAAQRCGAIRENKEASSTFVLPAIRTPSLFKAFNFGSPSCFPVRWDLSKRIHLFFASRCVNSDELFPAQSILTSNSVPLYTF